MPLQQRFDRILFGATVALSLVGLAVMGSASWVLASERYGRAASYFVTWQAATAVVGFIAMVLAMHLRLDVVFTRRTAAVLVGLSWVLLVGAYLQPPVNHTHRWLSLGGFSLQPSVVARPALIVFVALALERARERGWSLASMVPPAVAVAGTGLLIVGEPDLGSAALVFGVVGAMAYVAGTPVRFLVVPGATVLGGAALLIATSPWRLERVRAFLFDGGSAMAYQSHQSLIAVGSGGLFGRGYGAGLQKMFFLPEPHTDFVLAATAEELGFLGLLFLVVLTAVITWRGLLVALRLQHLSVHRSLMAFGLTAAFTFQALLHAAVCLRLLPPKGIPFPLVSYGKTDLLITLLTMGLLLNLSRGASNHTVPRRPWNAAPGTQEVAT
jgi:cell division protein FtsW